MPDLVMEQQHLAEANRHIAIAHDKIAQVKEQMAINERLQIPLGESRALLETMKQTLELFEEHRALILRTNRGHRVRQALEIRAILLP